ncbi:hypothetical protein PISMIDRAFT_671689 [Pisolithus microcarpus 441]|uniref:Uncharacterized protein n=1 Tax=Pisolithus microcarpus 441 TaxID=765257 RepID=A0A0C9YX90_9AGAM|nr:hypothetical protein PISMIDRAFT_671689 [Pisolithus microcarpus 441]
MLDLYSRCRLSVAASHESPLLMYTRERRPFYIHLPRWSNLRRSRIPERTTWKLDLSDAIEVQESSHRKHREAYLFCGNATVV